MKENMIQRHPLKNHLKPREAAQMAGYLISPASASISGQVFSMDYKLVSFKS
ncbi:hypothetical protein NYQ10_15150 [Flavobacterium johnsoniae]|jgi:enoyl-[acyl-carrier-protein] reductase (NADH)|uniref:hypothetical protein n=1 Tax=Flavobacterium johnsoniae TaxID=986 RepID=UPI0025B1C5AE|nr:hypothetical protein [Flavobacterium johnsoniae]WJS93428.1 hypothetical protein NYQ10_15150 [Flavobacterium johnsoniae]